jgi:hypothetical protein
MRRKNKRHRILAAAREVCNTTRRLGDGSRLILRQRVRGSARAVRAIRNTRVYQTEPRVVADDTQDATHHVTIYNGTREFLKHKSRNKTYISDEQLHAMELCIYHGINVQVEGLDDERISQICRCAGSQSCRAGDRRNDWVWVTQRPGRCYGALNGRLPWQLQRLFKIKLLNVDGAFVEYWLALVLTTIPENSGNLDPVSKFVHVRKAPAAVALQVFSV